jgi:hypothetical protein
VSAQPPAKKIAAGLIQKETLKKRISNNECRRESFDPESFNLQLTTEGLVAGCGSVFCGSLFRPGGISYEPKLSVLQVELVA